MSSLQNTTFFHESCLFYCFFQFRLKPEYQPLEWDRGETKALEQKSALGPIFVLLWASNYNLSNRDGNCCPDLSVSGEMWEISSCGILKSFDSYCVSLFHIVIPSFRTLKYTFSEFISRVWSESWSDIYPSLKPSSLTRKYCCSI